jgi:hypothetical protein
MNPATVNRFKENCHYHQLQYPYRPGPYAVWIDQSAEDDDGEADQPLA